VARWEGGALPPAAGFWLQPRQKAKNCASKKTAGDSVRVKRETQPRQRAVERKHPHQQGPMRSATMHERPHTISLYLFIVVGCSRLWSVAICVFFGYDSCRVIDPLGAVEKHTHCLKIYVFTDMQLVNIICCCEKLDRTSAVFWMRALQLARARHPEPAASPVPSPPSPAFSWLQL